jgi:hypothetical protein
MMRMPVLTSALRVRKVLHHLQGLKLPLPMTPAELGLGFAGSLLALFLLARGVRASMPQLVLILLLVVGIVVLLRARPVDGKSTPQLGLTLLRWLGSPGRLIGDRPELERERKVMVTAFVRGEPGEDLSRWTPSVVDMASPALAESAPAGEEWAEMVPVPAASNGNVDSHIAGAAGR